MQRKGIRGHLNSLWLWVIYLFGGAMKGASDKIIAPKSNEGEINHKMSIGGVMNDLLEMRETQEVKELRDSYYRILEEADKYKADVPWKDSGPLSGVAYKVNTGYFDKNIAVYNPSLLPIRVIQDNNFIQKRKQFDAAEVLAEYKSSSILDYDTTLTITRDGFRPRFEIEKFANKIVVLGYGEKNMYDIHIYTTMYASQFGKIDALYIAELNRMKNEPGYKTEITDIKEISFVTDKSYHCDNRCEFRFSEIRYKGIEVYDGNFVLMFTGRAEVDGVSVGEKYKTESLTKKYEEHDKKTDAVDVFTIERNMDKYNKEEKKKGTYINGYWN